MTISFFSVLFSLCVLVACFVFLFPELSSFNHPPRIPKKLALIIEPRSTPLLGAVLSNFVANLRSDWHFLLLHSAQNQQLVRSLRVVRQLQKDRRILARAIPELTEIVQELAAQNVSLSQSLKRERAREMYNELMVSEQTVIVPSK